MLAPKNHRARPFRLPSILIFVAACFYLWNTWDTPVAKSNIHVVVAATSGEDYSWAEAVRIPDHQVDVIPYIADNMTAPHHPPQNKGHEALIYLTYLYEHYDKLPDYSIFVHATETPWHIEPLIHNMSWALTHVDLEEVSRRQYINLRISWQFGCPNWIHPAITKPNEKKTEEIYIKKAFSEIFPQNEVPEVFSAPCCSQFAVTRDAIRAVPRSQYKLWMDWIMTTDLDDGISGRIWEHFWPYVFRKMPYDCPVEWRAYCAVYGICFEGAPEFEAWSLLDRERMELSGELQWKIDNYDMTRREELAQRIQILQGILGRHKEKALAKGDLLSNRVLQQVALYED